MNAALVLVSLTLSLSAFAGESVVLTVDIHEVLTLKKVSKTRFEKISDNAIGTIKLDYTEGSATQNLLSQTVNESDTTSKEAFEVTGKNILKIEDPKNGINREVEADINTSLFTGSIKSIRISAGTVQSLYAASMKKAGLDVLANLKIATGGAFLSTSFLVGDMLCKADGDLLVCKQDSTLTMGFEKI